MSAFEMTVDRLAEAERKVQRDPDDDLAAERLRVERARVGLCPDHGLALTGTVRRTCPGCRSERKATNARRRRVQRLADMVYQDRVEREVHPEGEFDAAGRWYPTDREDAGDITGRVRSPSRAWPYGYIKACRSKRHCRVLVERALKGLDVPGDVELALEAIGEG